MSTATPLWLIRLQARWRIWWNLCPACNSDAPGLDNCRLCEGARDYPLTDEQRERYRKAYKL